MQIGNAIPNLHNFYLQINNHYENMECIIRDNARKRQFSEGMITQH